MGEGDVIIFLTVFEENQQCNTMSVASVYYILIQHRRTRLKYIAVGIVSKLMGGCVETISTLGSMAYRAL